MVVIHCARFQRFVVCGRVCVDFGEQESVVGGVRRACRKLPCNKVVLCCRRRQKQKGLLCLALLTGNGRRAQPTISRGAAFTPHAPRRLC